MTDKSFSTRLIEPTQDLRNRLRAWSAGFGARPAPVGALPEPMFYGEADRGAALVRGRWLALGREIDLAGGTIWDAAAQDRRIIALRETCEWIDDLAALGTRPARSLAQTWVQDWAQRFGAGRGPGWRAEATGRRVMRWVAHSAWLTGGFEPAEAARFWRALAAQQRFLAGAWPQAEPGLPRMFALAGLIWSGRALAHPGQPAAVAALGDLAQAAVGPEGAVASRSPEELSEVLTLLVWTARLLEDGGAAASPAHLEAIVRAVPVLRQLRLVGGHLPRFHGGGAGDANAIDKALAELRLDARAKARLPMGYARLSGGRVVVVMDGALPPAGAAAATAHASALAFEMSVGRQPVLASAGPGALFGPEHGARARRTSAHCAVEAGGASSAAFIDGALAPGPTLVSVRQAQDATGMWLVGTQDGYVASHGLLHERRIFVEAKGTEVRGEEILSVTDARSRAAFDRAAGAERRLGIAVRFHLHPEIGVKMHEGGAFAELALPSGEVWEMRAGGGQLSLEDAVYFDGAAAEPRPARQVVVRAEAVEYLGQITWFFGRVVEAPRAGPAERLD